jgi:hypothetical protein
MLRLFIGLLLVFLIAVSALAAETYITNYVREGGNYIHPYVHSTPEGDPADNGWGSRPYEP